MKRSLTLLLALSLCYIGASAKSYSVKSPNGRLVLSLETGAQSSWALAVDGTVVTAGNRLGMELSLSDGKTKMLGDKPTVRKSIKSKVRGEVETPLYRQKSVREDYNGLTLQMKDGWAIELRAYDQGVAYRFLTSMKDSITVKNEVYEFRTGGKMDAVIAYHYGKARDDIYESSFENEYEYIPAGTAPRSDRFAFFPMVADTKGKGKLLLTESDILDYPGMFIKTGAEVWTAEFPGIPRGFRYSHRFNQHRFDYSDVIARTAGSRTFPWRVIGWGEKDGDLAVNDLSWLLATPSRLDDFSWVTPGLSAWDWWNDFKLIGVDFPCGINTQTYKYHIDFAERFGLKYILMDEGWYKAPDIFKTIPEIDLPEICRYAASKGIKVVVWSTGALVDKCDMEKVCSTYSKMGVAGLKLDFFDGQDQLTVRQIQRLAETTARHGMLLDLHGMYKPAGLNRTYPNVIGFEGVYGEENLSRKGINLPLYDVTFPYIRQACGPTDYTPGAMRNAAMNEAVRVARGGASQGTRSHQVALYVVLDQPYGMLCDSPSLYERESETTSFITSIPTVFDRTFIQTGTIGESIVSVRQKDGKWYVGGLTDWNAREVSVSFDFLSEGQWKATLYKDGVNADKYGEDFIIESMDVDASTVLPIRMAQGGGFAMIIEKR
ncbi:MAG: glycoside hydrolase family 97 protein [Bacteroidales bacterium]|nr:glycoside hydrolase family 97 protein [Bacteroidales bacterium]